MSKSKLESQIDRLGRRMEKARYELEILVHLQSIVLQGTWPGIKCKLGLDTAEFLEPLITEHQKKLKRLTDELQVLDDQLAAAIESGVLAAGVES